MKQTKALIFFCILFSLMISADAIAASGLEIDLRSQWLVFKNNDYRLLPAEADVEGNTIYMKISPSEYSNSILQVSSPNYFSIFINGVLSVGNSKNVQLSLDSIQQVTGAFSMLVAIHQRGRVNEERLDTRLITQQVVANDPLIVDRASTYFRDFVVLGVFIILLLLLLMVGQNAKLAADYFSIRRLFGAPGSQDSLTDNRTTSSSNILFQAFCSLLGGFLLTILFTHLKGQYAIASIFSHESLWGSILSWIILSAVILTILLVKQLIIYLFAYLFGIMELAVAHYFNMIRLLFWVLGLSAIGGSTYFIVHGNTLTVFENIYFLIGWALGFWVLLIFIKLSRRVGFSMFHLFSYLCATEIIPLIITIKVLYY